MKAWKWWLSFIVGMVFGSLACGAALRLVPTIPELCMLLGTCLFVLMGGMTAMLLESYE